MESTRKKYQNLLAFIRKYPKMAIAFSGGTDSAFLLKAALDAFETADKILALTAISPVMPGAQTNEAIAFAKSLSIRHCTVHSLEMQDDAFLSNPPDRCYICKKIIMGAALKIAHEKGFEVLAEGSNSSDDGDYRPGMRAVKELGILSPLRAVNLSKPEIRALSEKLGLPTWNKPSSACLASRIPYTKRISRSKLKIIENAEDYLHQLGFLQVRVRHHEDIARIEVDSSEFIRLIEHKHKVTTYLESIGYHYVTLDLKGFRSGSLNEQL